MGIGRSPQLAGSGHLGTLLFLANVVIMSKRKLEIDSTTRDEWERRQRLDARDASAFYFERILPAVVRHHQQDAAPVPRIEFLVSLMGLSPETTAIATAFLKPTRLEIVASHHSLRYCDQCIEFLAANALIRPEMISVRRVDPTDHDELFKALCDALATTTESRLVDVTGGKKVMSAVAGYAAWINGVPICYLESGAYNEQMRRPEPGSETLVILEPPGQRDQ